MDRFDIQCEILPVPFEKLSGMAAGEPSAAIRERVVKVHEVQDRRCAGEKGIFCNAQMNTRLMKQYCQLERSVRRY